MTARRIRNEVEGLGTAFADLGAILDFGCGCGRLARHWAGLQGPEIHATDINSANVEWCREHLPFIEATKNELEPPLHHPEERFELVYAISVFTHLPTELQERWLAELTRVLRPGGLLLLTLHGKSFAERHLAPREKARFDTGEPIVLHGSLAGSNGCFAFHPSSYVERELLRGLDLLVHRRQDAVPEVGQDVYVAQRPDA